MIVLDTSALIDLLLRTPAGSLIETRLFARRESLHAPDVLDLEVAQVLRRLVREATISEGRAEQAVHDLFDLRITRYPHFLFLPRIWHHRHNLSAYDAAYVCLAEDLDAPLVTRDGRLASASGHKARIEVF